MVNRLKLFIRVVLERFRIFKIVYWKVVNLGYATGLFSVNEIPIIINNFNRLTYPIQLISFLEKCGCTRIIILDNNSTYPPLLEYYKTCPHKVIRGINNFGHLALWKSGLYHRYKWNYFVYTDSDVVPSNECPEDFMRYFKELLDKFAKLDKIGFAIRIDDLPDSFAFKAKVISYEKKYWEQELTSNVFDAPIDTTFALYKPLTSLRAGEIYTRAAARVGFPYVVRHLPWYVDSLHLSDEEKYYLATSNSSSTIGKQVLGVTGTY